MHFWTTKKLIEAFAPRHLSAMVTGRDAIGKVIHRLSVMGMPKVSWLMKYIDIYGLECEKHLVLEKVWNDHGMT